MILMPNAKQVIDGKLSDVEEICVVHAARTFRARKSMDTNPQIVRMREGGGQPFAHWYYKSNEWIDQPYVILDRFIEPYTGPVDRANPLLYGEGTFIPDIEITNFLSREDISSRF